jgi:hypothetical protein
MICPSALAVAVIVRVFTARTLGGHLVMIPGLRSSVEFLEAAQEAARPFLQHAGSGVVGPCALVARTEGDDRTESREVERLPEVTDPVPLVRDREVFGESRAGVGWKIAT